MITISPNDFLLYTGINLDIELADLDDASNKVNRAIILWTDRIYDLMRQSARKIPEDKDLSEFQVISIKRAICEYGMYYLKNGDLMRQSGFDEDKGKLLDRVDIERLQYPSSCYDILRKAGLIRRSLGTSYVYSQNYDSYHY